MQLRIQDPFDPQSDYLLDSLRDACKGAVCGAGCFAFMSAGGVKLFFGDQAFQQFAHAGGSFALVTGVDAITDTKAMAALDQARQAMPSLTARVYLPQSLGSIFHPKCAWFETGNGGVLVTGSGNMTVGGLMTNVEAFTVTTLSPLQLGDIKARWQAYLGACASRLYATNDPLVVQRLQANAQLQQKAKAANAGGAEVIGPALGGGAAAVQPDVDELPQVTAQSGVLVAEIPKAGSRWQQGNFSASVFTSFFGTSAAVGKPIYLFPVQPNGTVGHQEVRPPVVVASHNYRFELGAAKGLPYPANGRAIGVFVRVSVRTFLYQVLLPGEPGHAEMGQLLNGTQPPGAHMRRIEYAAAAVRAAWPTAPFWTTLTV